MKTSGKEILQLLFDKLWDKYVERVPYAKMYANL